MAINFPDSPTLNQVFSAGGRTWKWDGTTWVSVGAELVVADITDLTATATEINYTDGVTSAIQTQLDGKAATVHTHTAGQINTDVVGASSGYTFVASDKNKFYFVGGTITLTVPANVFSAGDQIDVINDATGTITFAAGAGLSLRAVDSKVTLNKQYAGASIKFQSATVAYLVGNLA